MRAARVLGHVPADRARRLRAGIGRVIQPVRLRRRGQLHVHHAGLDDRRAVRGVERQDPVHARERDQHRALERERAARQTGAGTARHERNAGAREHPDHVRDLRRPARQHDRARPRAVRGEAVGLVNEQRAGVRDQPAVAHDGAQLLRDRGVERR